MSDKSVQKNPAIFRQICELIPAHLVPKLARKHNVKHRAILPWSHVVSLLYAQFTRALGLNDVCDALRANTSVLASIRGAKPPSKNGLSNANRTRSPEMFKDLFWTVLNHLQTSAPGFGGPAFGQLPRRFRLSSVMRTLGRRSNSSRTHFVAAWVQASRSGPATAAEAPAGSSSVSGKMPCA